MTGWLRSSSHVLMVWARLANLPRRDVALCAGSPTSMFSLALTGDPLVKLCTGALLTSMPSVNKMCNVRETWMPRRQRSQNLAKSRSPTFLPHPIPGAMPHVISVKCEQPLDELTVQVWFILYPYPNLKYCTWYRWFGIMYRQMDARTDNWITRCQRGPFRPHYFEKFWSMLVLLLSWVMVNEKYVEPFIYDVIMLKQSSR